MQPADTPDSVNEPSATSTYYERNAAAFFANTVNVDMTSLYRRFLSKLPSGASILDAGCGSGRDARAFSAMGYRVTAFDASPELANLASNYCGFEVQVRQFMAVDEVDAYDGIWCCASLLHVPKKDLAEVLARIWRALRPGGTLYVSFKRGKGERIQGGRFFTDVEEAELAATLSTLPHASSPDTWITEDQRPDRLEQWVNALITREPVRPARLVTGGSDPFLPHISHALAGANEIDIAVAFVKVTGLRLLMPDLLAALNDQRSDQDNPIKVRILTSDYLDVTDPEALRLLLLLQEMGAKVKVYSTREGGSFHLKAYIFAGQRGGSTHPGTAFIGSSNISRQALQEGLEWNYRINYPGDTGFLEARANFDVLFDSPRSLMLTDRWIEDYEKRRIEPPRAIAPGSHEREPAPEPNAVQRQALAALEGTRQAGYRRGLVVLATGLGKTWLAAFDSVQASARRVLFVAHREEILTQAASTFIRIRPQARVGYYMGQSRDAEIDVLCASVQTLARAEHLERFSPQHFDYIVVDEFHHAAAATYRKLLSHFAPAFLLGLTATPERTDQSDILSLCDNNCVFSYDLFSGVEAGLLSPFHYYGIFDQSVDYKEIPWRNGKFDPQLLSHKLATLARARHVLKEWMARKQLRTLAFCVSTKHADYMADQFNKAGVRSAAVYSGSTLGRSEALEQLRSGQLQVIFSVDLFSEGVDLPVIDTVMMLRPTESKILFLQQLGRGLRRADGKDKLVVLDFIGNHAGFLHKPQALFHVGSSFKALADFARSVEAGRLELPEGCFVNYDLALIDFLKSLDSTGPAKDYEALRSSLGRRPTLSEYYRSGSSIQAARNQFGSWFELVMQMHELESEQARALTHNQPLLRYIETTPMNKSFKMPLLEAFLELGGLSADPTIDDLCERSWTALGRRRDLAQDLPSEDFKTEDGRSNRWRSYWIENPIRAVTGGNSANPNDAFFLMRNDRLGLRVRPSCEDIAALAPMIQELIEYRLASYESRTSQAPSSNVIPFPVKQARSVELPYFPNLKIACGHFRTGRADSEEHRALPMTYGQLDPSRYFIARASGNSMNGGKNPIRDGDYLLLEHVTPSNAGSITGSIMAIEREDARGDGDQYLLRVVTKGRDGKYVLRANNPDYADLPANDEMRTRARLKAIIDPLDMALGQTFSREEIPPLFGEGFNAGKWNVGHVVLNEKSIHVLLVTLNKQGKADEHRYHDYWIDEEKFHWQSQNSTEPDGKRGQEIINHLKRGIEIHLFVREGKLSAGKGAPFTYHGKVNYVSHTGSGPMSVIFRLQ